MMARDVIDLPEPDSPTIPRTSPGAMEKLRSRTAGSVPAERAALDCPVRRAAVWKEMFRLRTSRSEATVSC